MLTAEPLVLAPGVAREVDVPINGAVNWNLVISNVGANPVTALSLRKSPLGVGFGAAKVVTTDIPIAAGSPGNPTPYDLNGQLEPLKFLRLIVTSTLGTSITIEGGGR